MVARYTIAVRRLTGVVRVRVVVVEARLTV
jgi:hypothetical protein